MTTVSGVASALIEGDLPCSICEYNLKGLSPAGDCPECGQAIVRTFTYDLSHADAGWLRRQGLGLLLLPALFVLGFVAPNRYAGLAAAPAIWQVLNVAGAGAALAACVLLSSADPARGSGDRDLDGTYRRGLRLSAALLMGLFVLGQEVMRPFIRSSPQWIFAAALIDLIATQLLALLMVVRLARRTKDAALERWANVVRYALPGILVIGSVASFTGREWYEAVVAFYAAYAWAAPLTVYGSVFVLGRVYERVRGAAGVSRGRVVGAAGLVEGDAAVVSGEEDLRSSPGIRGRP